MKYPVQSGSRSSRLPLFRSYQSFATRTAFAALISAVSLPFALPSAQAANFSWDGGTANIATTGDGISQGGSGTWSTALSNWDVGNGSAHSVWVNGNTAIFDGTAGTVNLGTAISAAGVNFNVGGYTIATGANTLTLTGPITTAGIGGTTTFSGTVAATGAQTWTVGTGDTLQFDAAFTGPASGVAFQINSNGTTNITGNFSVAGKSTLAGTGTFNLSGTENFLTSATDYAGIAGATVNNTAGTATFSPGTGNAFFIGNTGTTQASTLNVTGGTVSVSTATRVFIGDGFSGTAIAGDGTLSVGGGAGAALFTLGTTTNATAITLGNSVATGTINLNTNGTFAGNRNIAAGAAGKGILNFNGGTFQATGTASAIAASVTTNVLEGGAIIDTQTFATTIAANFTHGGVAATDGGIRIASSTATPGAVTLSGILSQTGGLTVNSAATVSGNNTYTGATAINAFVDGRTNGTFLGATGAGNGTTINTGGTIRFRDTGNTTIAEAITFNGGTFYTYNDPGTTTLSGLLTLNAATTISVSPQAQTSTVLALSGGIVDGTTLNNNVAFSRIGAAAAASSDVLSITGASTYGGTTAITDALNTNTGNFSVRLSGGNNRLPTGTVVTLGGTAGGGVAAGSGRLVLGDTTSGAMSQTLAGLVTSGTGTRNAVVGGAAAVSTLNLNIASGTNTFGGLLGGTAANENNLALTKSGAGLLTLTAANTYTGGTTISGGTIITGNSAALGVGPVTISINGTLNIGDVGGTATVGTLALGANTLTLSGGGALTMTLTNTATSDTISLTGAATLSGTLALNTTNNINYTNSYTLISGSSGVTTPGLLITGYDSTNYTANLSSSGVLSFTPVPEPSTYACMVVALGGLAIYARNRRARREA